MTIWLYRQQRWGTHCILQRQQNSLQDLTQVKGWSRKTLKETEIKVGEPSDDKVEVMSGLKAGDMIALPVKGQTLKENVEVEILQSSS